MLKTTTYEIPPQCAVFPTFEPMKKHITFLPALANLVENDYRYLQKYVHIFVVGLLNLEGYGI
jgi:hypothetical protein